MQCIGVANACSPAHLMCLQHFMYAPYNLRFVQRCTLARRHHQRRLGGTACRSLASSAHSLPFLEGADWLLPDPAAQVWACGTGGRGGAAAVRQNSGVWQIALVLAKQLLRTV